MRWDCAVCGDRIDAKYQGWLHASPNGGSASDFRATHVRCEDIDAAGFRYAVPVHEVMTAEGALRWTLHLEGKPWYVRSGWASLLRDKLGPGVP